MKNQKIQYLMGALSAFALLTVACTSEKEKEERRENAFDVSGFYKTSQSSGSTVDMNFEIHNESGRHDIVSNLERTSDFTDQERQLLVAQGLDADKIFAHFRGSLVLGKGYNSGHLEGGENVSRDFGESSEFFVCTPTYKYDAEYSLAYCLSGLVKKKDKVVDGGLSLRWMRSRKVTVEGEERTEYSADQVELKYHSDISLIFYKQYLGAWSGEVFPLANDFATQVFERLSLTELPDGASFSAQLSQASSFVYQNETYNYDSTASKGDISLLKESDYPAVQIVLRSESGKRIVLFGQLWSLGDFTGSITLIDGANQKDLATFRLKKD